MTHKRSLQMMVVGFYFLGVAVGLFVGWMLWT
jgi:hypothetical protein